MSSIMEGGLVPVWTLGDRLRKARSLTGLTVAEFAARIGVSDKTINNAEGDKRAVRPITLNAWAHETGVSREWLETGVGSPGGPHPPHGHPADDKASALARLAAKKRPRHAAGAVTRAYPSAA